MLELYVMKVTRTVPRRERGGNSSDLADRGSRPVLRETKGEVPLVYLL
jgi:hypothetical protein